jgi:phage recombination protein Bet
MASGIVKYQASDGQEITLSPQIVAKYIITGNAQADDKDVYSFIAKCKARRLNPLAGDAYMTVFKNHDGGTSASVIVSKDYFLRTATSKDNFDGFKAGVVVANKHTGELTYREGCIVGSNSEALIGGWAEVSVKGRSVPSRSEVSLNEYDQHRSLWKSKPATMIRKVALVQALREAYPGEFGGVYDSDEMDDQPEPPIQTTAQLTDQPQPEPAPQQTEPEVYEEDQDF